MNRQQALNQLRLMQAWNEDFGNGPCPDYDAICYAIGVIEAQPKELDNLIKALEAEHKKLLEMQKALKNVPDTNVGDTISRQAAIEDIRTMNPKDAQLDIKWVEMWLKQLPSAQPEPCEDAVKSHSEKDILNMCISLLDEMVGYFGEYMEWIGYEPTKEEKVCGYFGMTYFHIVQKLFLYHTTHSGGTSTFKKCHELGIDDPSDGVRFPLWKEEEEDAE